MKKRNLVALILVLVMLTLCACGGKNSADDYIGVWESEHMRFTINKGGIGKFEMLTSLGGTYDFSYEVEDGVFVLTIEFMGDTYLSSLELSEDGTTLTIVQNGLPTYATGEDTFVKQ